MSEERVRLVLDIEGIADANALKEAIRELTDAMGATATTFQNVTTSAQAAGAAQQQAATQTQAATQATAQATSASMSQTAQAAAYVSQATTQAFTQAGSAAQQFASQFVSTANAAAAAMNNLAGATAGGGAGATPPPPPGGGGGGGGGGRGGGGNNANNGGRSFDAASAMLMLAYAMEDAQYGLRGVMNNIPPLLMMLGVNRGLVGVLQMTLVAVNQIIERMPELFAKLEKWKPTVESMFDPTKKWSDQIELAQKYLDQLGKSTSMSAETLEKYRNTLERIKQMEKELKEQRDNQKAAEEIIADKGVLDAERVAQYQKAYKDVVQDMGRGEEVQNRLSDVFFNNAVNTEKNLDDSAWIKLFMSNRGNNQELEKAYRAEYEKQIKASGVNRESMTLKELAEIDQKTQDSLLSLRGKISVTKPTREGSMKLASDLIGRVRNAKTADDFDAAFQELEQLDPRLAAEIKGQYQYEKTLEIEEKELEAWKKSNQERRQRQAEFERDTPLPGGNMTADQRDRANANAREQNEFVRNRDRRVANERQAAQNNQRRNAEAEQSLDASFRYANQMLQQTGSDPMSLYAAAFNSGRTAAQKQRAIQGQTNILSAQMQQQGMTRADADVVAREIMKQGEQAVIAQRNQGNAMINAFGRIAWNAKYTDQQIQAIMRQMNLGVRPPSAQFGLRAR